MAVIDGEMVYQKAVINADVATNGGRIGSTDVQSGVRHNVFPRTTKAERVAGKTRYRKEGLTNKNASEDIAAGVLQWVEIPSLAEDRYYLAEATDDDTQADLTDLGYTWMGCGSLETAVGAGSGEVALTMESDDFQFPNGGYLHVSNNFLTSQTIGSGVSEGDSITLSVGTWSKADQSDDIIYPDGIYVGGNKVLTIHGSATEEWLEIADNHYSGEVIGAGTGATLVPELTTLSNITNGICAQPTKLPVVTATCDAVERTVNVANDGTCSGYCSAGTLNMDTGVWTADISWTTEPDNGTDIEVDYHENCYKYAGNVATVELTDTLANSYLTTNTYGSGCVYDSEVKPTVDSFVVTSVSGTYDDTGSPLTLYNLGTIDDVITITMTGATTFSASAVNAGSLGTGSIGTDFEPVNPDTSVKYFSLLTGGWGGTYVSGDTISIPTYKATAQIWLKSVVPAGTTQEPNNEIQIRFYNE